VGKRERLGKRRPSRHHVLAHEGAHVLVGQPCVQRIARDPGIASGRSDRAAVVERLTVREPSTAQRAEEEIRVLAGINSRADNARHASNVEARRSGGSVNIGIPYSARSRFMLAATILRLRPSSSNDEVFSTSTIIRRVTAKPSP
jgi:hypothetical protein